MGGGNDIIYDKILGELPPESTKFEWPLYINIPFVEEYESTYMVLYAYEKRDDIILQQLVNWLEENKNFLGSSVWGTDYDAYPPELYINGIHITKCMCFVDPIFGEVQDWVLYVVPPEHIADAQIECGLSPDGASIYLNITIAK